MNIESMLLAFDMSLFSILSFVLIDHSDCLKVERFNHVGYIMNCLSITNHCYACENCLVKQMITLTMTRLMASLMSNGLTRGNACYILHTWTTLYAFCVSRIKGRKEILLHRIDILVNVIYHHVLLLCIVHVTSVIPLMILMCFALNKHTFNINWENISKNLNPTKTVLVISDNHWNLILLSITSNKKQHPLLGRPGLTSNLCYKRGLYFCPCVLCIKEMVKLV